MLEKTPSYQGKFTFVQMGSSSRTHIKRYHDLLADVEAECERINCRFQTGKWKPIVFVLRKVVKEQNIYRWAGSIIGELCGLRLDSSRDTPSRNRASALLRLDEGPPSNQQITTTL
jgi:trehalose-6-phosphate synthase